MEEFKLQSLAKDKNVIASEEDFVSGFNKVFAPYPNDVKQGEIAAPAVKETVQTIKEEVAENLITEKDLSDSRTKGYEEGYAKGYAAAKSASEELDKAINVTIREVDKKLAAILAEKKIAEVKQAEDVVNVVLKIAEKVAGTALSQNPDAEVEKVVKKSFELLFDETKIVVLVNSKTVDIIRNKIEQLAKLEGFTGEVEIKGNDKIALGSCNIQWEGGGLSSDKDALWEEISGFL